MIKSMNPRIKIRSAARKPKRKKILSISAPPYRQASRRGDTEKPVTVGMKELSSSGSASGGLVGTGRGVGVSTTGCSIAIVGVGGKLVGVTVGLNSVS